MTVALRRGACPSLRAPMETGDGLLVRLPRSESPLAATTVLAIAGAARRFGNGLIEVTGRGAIQVRGLSPDSAGPFAEALSLLGLPGDDGPTLISGALSGRDPSEQADVRALMADLRQQIAESGLADRLAPKIAVVVDGGGALHLDDISADLRLTAYANADGAGLSLSLAGAAEGARVVGTLAPADAVSACLALLGLIAEHGPAGRARDLVAVMDDAAIQAATGRPLSRPVPMRARPRAEPLGQHDLADGTVAVGVGLAFGQTDAGSIEALVAAATEAGAEGLAPAAGRVLIAIGIPASRAEQFVKAAAGCGFVTNPNDPRRSVFACAGSPACGQGKMPARALGPAAARAAAAILDGSIALHISGCAKGCAHPGTAEHHFRRQERRRRGARARREGGRPRSHCDSARGVDRDDPARRARPRARARPGRKLRRGARPARRRCGELSVRVRAGRWIGSTTSAMARQSTSAPSP